MHHAVASSSPITETKFLPKYIRWIFYVLSVFLPIQTLIAQFTINRLGFPFWTVFWKEGLVAVLILYFAIESLRYLLKNPFSWKFYRQTIWPILLYSLAICIILISSLANRLPHSFIVYGFRFDLFWVGLFAIAMTWWNLKIYGVSNIKDTPRLDTEMRLFGHKLTKSILIGFGLVGIISLASLILGQSYILGLFGFGQQSTSLLTTAPLGHVIDYSENGYRLSGGFSTPNHFAAYLLLVLPILLTIFRERLVDWYNLKHSLQNKILLCVSGLAVILAITLLILSFARFAFLGLLTWGIYTLVIHFVQEPDRFLNWIHLERTARFILWTSLLLPLVIGIFAINIDPTTSARYLPGFLVKPSSTILHYRHTLSNIAVLQAEPIKIITGYGLGTSGPSGKPEYSNFNFNPIFTRHGSIAYDWGLVGEDLIIPENWYIQLIMSGGIIYTLLYIALVSQPAWILVKTIKNLQPKLRPTIQWPQVYAGLGFFSILVGNLFLHVWENQTVAFYWTILWIWVITQTPLTKRS